jgi:hypothetical protein
MKRAQGFGGQLGMREMDMLYGRARKVSSEPEQFAAKVRRLHQQGLRSTNIATLLDVELSAVAAALSEVSP